jgi:CIC family chloride channel protein
VLELTVLADSPARGRSVGEIDWPAGSIVAAVTQGREIHAAHPALKLQAGERVIVLAPAGEQRAEPAAAGELSGQGAPSAR